VVNFLHPSQSIGGYQTWPAEGSFHLSIVGYTNVYTNCGRLIFASSDSFNCLATEYYESRTAVFLGLGFKLEFGVA